jgi:hypothetical protein
MAAAKDDSSSHVEKAFVHTAQGPIQDDGDSKVENITEQDWTSEEEKKLVYVLSFRCMAPGHC